MHISAQEGSVNKINNTQCTTEHNAINRYMERVSLEVAKRVLQVGNPG